MKRLLLFAFLLTAPASRAQTFHVKSVHVETQQEHGGEVTMMRYLKVIGTFDGKTYTIEALQAGWNELEVGQDYSAALNKDEIKILFPYKKNSKNKTSWRILTVEE